ncbi:hypothetical protein H072_9782 [Dactylellina haptotyla CBS 200.50]|uniref:Phosphoglycerate mutase-like protein n=1 Tax=Dactylellina haptotyla (strain CBS 200.50) TaxID=1284197 RepID=S8BN33_DACHA|nr:hypothetical protein H072_9782 [Dactylellina haptotyla CBS 200.50]
MVLKSICMIRHASRAKLGDVRIQEQFSNLDETKALRHSETPASRPVKHQPDDGLTVIGKQQAEELARYLTQAHPDIKAVYVSKNYRCLETIKPFMEQCERTEKQVKLRFEPGLVEWKRIDRVTPRPPSSSQLKKYHPKIDIDHEPLCVPLGHENVDEYYDRCAYFLARLIETMDTDPNGPESVLLCTSASNVVWCTRVLLGIKPGDPQEKDFMVPAIGFYKFIRKGILPVKIKPDQKNGLGYIKLDWETGTALGGSWSCTHKADCSFLSSGPIMVWGAFATDIPAHLSPSEARKLPPSQLPNFFDIQETDAQKKTITVDNKVGSGGEFTITTTELLVD